MRWIIQTKTQTKSKPNQNSNANQKKPEIKFASIDEVRTGKVSLNQKPLRPKQPGDVFCRIDQEDTISLTWSWGWTLVVSQSQVQWPNSNWTPPFLTTVLSLDIVNIIG